MSLVKRSPLRVPLLSALFLLWPSTSCSLIDSMLHYQEAARQLSVSVDRWTPALELAFPLDRSRIRITATLLVDNPSDVRFRAAAPMADLFLEGRGQVQALGKLDFPPFLDLAPKQATRVEVSLLLEYKDLKPSWELIQANLVKKEPAVWRLQGRFMAQAARFGMEVPFQARKSWP